MIHEVRYELAQYLPLVSVEGREQSPSNQGALQETRASLVTMDKHWSLP